MADDWSIWFYEPSLPLAIIGTIVYAIICIAISYLTLVKHRAWYFTPVVVGAVVEVAAYIARIISLKNVQNLVSLLFVCPAEQQETARDSMKESDETLMQLCREHIYLRPQ